MKKANRLTLALLLIAPLSLSAQADKRIALVIGNGTYQFNTTLRNPANDARDIAASLAAKGFAVTTLIDATRAQMEKSIRDFGASLKDPAAVGLFFFSGHGAQADGQNYILPVDADIQDVDELRYKAVDSESVLAKMRSAGNRLNIVMLDACRNNPFPGATKSGERGLAVVKIKVPESVIVYATDPGATAADGEGRNSPFTSALLAQMDVPGQDIAIMLKRVTSAVRASTGGAQSPWISSNLSTDFAFAPAGVPAPPAYREPTQPLEAPARIPTVSISRPSGSIKVSAAAAGSLLLDGTKLADLPAGSEALLEGIETGEHRLELHYGDGVTDVGSATVVKGQTTTVVFSRRPLVALTTPKVLEPISLVAVPGGSFAMGSELGVTAANTVVISAFLMGKYEITFEQYDAFCASTGKPVPLDLGWGRDKRPVMGISWKDAIEFCNWRSTQDGLKPCYDLSGATVTCDFRASGWRLPTEAEWEYAARGGSANAGRAYALGSEAELTALAWYKANSGERIHPVGQKKANPLGLHDMAGNVWEWCWDWYGVYQDGTRIDPTGPETGEGRVGRGGSWDVGDRNLRPTIRGVFSPDSKEADIGFRVVRRP